MEKMMIKTSDHYVFHFPINSLAAKEIDSIIAEQEKSYQVIVKTLGVTPKFKIDYYLLDTPETVGEAYGDYEPCNGFAKKPHDVYAVYNDKIKCIGPHEDAHIISYLLSTPEYVFMREGLAMYFDRTQAGKANEIWVQEYLASGQYLKVVDLLDDEYFYHADPNITYPIAGAFTKYLIEKLGTNSYVEAYRLADFSQTNLQVILRCTDIDRDFTKWIQKMR